MKEHAANPDEPVVLVGHSYGGDSVLRVAAALQDKGVAVNLTVTVDPAGKWGAMVENEHEASGNVRLLSDDRPNHWAVTT